jgi:hypothetical protein
LVCTTKFDIVSDLSHVICIGDKQERRQAVLIVNNLVIPRENKAAILLGEPVHALLPALLRIIQHRTSETYLSTVCLFNLSFLQPDGKSILMDYVIPAQFLHDYCDVTDQSSSIDDGDDHENRQALHAGTSSVATGLALSQRATLSPPLSSRKQLYKHMAPYKNPHSLLKILEGLLNDYVPVVLASFQDFHNLRTMLSDSPKQHALPPASVQSEAVRWTMGIIRNLTASHAVNASIVTEYTPVVIQYAVQLLAASPVRNDVAAWNQHSLEDSCLLLLLQLTTLFLPTTPTDQAETSIVNDEAVFPNTKYLFLSALGDVETVTKMLQGIIQQQTGGIHELRASAVLHKLKCSNTEPVPLRDDTIRKNESSVEAAPRLGKTDTPAAIDDDRTTSTSTTRGSSRHGESMVDEKEVRSSGGSRVATVRVSASEKKQMTEHESRANVVSV